MSTPDEAGSRTAMSAPHLSPPTGTPPVGDASSDSVRSASDDFPCGKGSSSDAGEVEASSFTSTSPHLVTSERELAQAVKNLMAGDEFVVDVETDGRRPVENRVSWVGLAGPGQRYLIPIGHPNGTQLTEPEVVEEPDMSTVRPYKNNPAKFTKPKMRKVHKPATFTDPPEQLAPHIVWTLIEPLFFGDVLDRKPMKVIGHNLKYDLMSLAKYFGKLPTGPYVDTLVLQHVMDETLTSYSLKNLTCEWALGKAAKNPEVRKKFYPELGKGGIDNFSVQDVAKYLAKDISYTYWMYRRLWPKMLRDGLLDAFLLEMNLYPVLMEMELTGIHIDRQHLLTMQKQLHETIDATRGALYAEVGYEFKISSPTEKRKILFEPKSKGGQGLKPLTYTPKTNQPQVNSRFLEHYRDENKIVGYLAEYIELEKLRSTFVDKFLEPGLLVGDRVHGSLNQHRAETGRLSSSDPNLQQIPARSEIGREFRKSFVPTPGYDMFVADYSQIELRAVAHLSGEKELSRVLIANEDLHTAAAAAAYNVSPEDVTPEQRAIGKTMNFLILYGGGAKRLAASANIDVQEAERLISRYFSRYPGLPKFKDKIVEEAWVYGADYGGIPTTFIPPYGRKRRVKELFSDDKYEVWSAQRQLVNSVVQGFAANIMKMALINVDRQLRKRWTHEEARLLLTVHDELIGEARDDIAEDVFEVVLEAMEDISYPDGSPILGNIPLVAEGGLGDNWVESK